MIKRHSSRKPRLALCAILASFCWWAAAPASAQTTTYSTSTSSTTTTTESHIVTVVSANLAAANENIAFVGKVFTTSKVVTDPDFGNPPTAVLSIDLRNLVGKGATTHAKYVVTGQFQIDRPLGPSDTLKLAFPYYLSGADIDTAQVGLATVNLTFNTGTFELTNVATTLGNP